MPVTVTHSTDVAGQLLLLLPLASFKGLMNRATFYGSKGYALTQEHGLPFTKADLATALDPAATAPTNTESPT